GRGRTQRRRLAALLRPQRPAPLGSVYQWPRRRRYTRSMGFRIEKDSLGEVQVPEVAYWGSQAERSRHLFQISGLTEHPKMIDAYVLLKKACAEANTEFGLLDAEIGR